MLKDWRALTTHLPPYIFPGGKPNANTVKQMVANMYMFVLCTSVYQINLFK